MRQSICGTHNFTFVLFLPHFLLGGNKMSNDIQVGSIVETEYNSGIYIGKVIEERRKAWLIEVQAIKKHPTQGDLHNPDQTQGQEVAFHERKALAHREKLNGPRRKTKIYLGEVPNYIDSLKNAFNELKEQLQARNDAYGDLALEKLADLDKSFYQKIYNK